MHPLEAAGWSFEIELRDGYLLSLPNGRTVRGLRLPSGEIGLWAAEVSDWGACFGELLGIVAPPPFQPAGAPELVIRADQRVYHRGELTPWWATDLGLTSW